MNYKRFMLILAALWGAILACNTPAASPTPSVGMRKSPQANTAAEQDRAATQTSPADITQPTDTMPAPTNTPLTLPTNTIPAPPPMPSSNFPSGFITAASDKSSITIYNLQAEIITQIQTPELRGGTASNLHLAGGVWADAVDGPLVYISFEDQGKIKQNFNGQISDLIPGPNTVNLSGVPGQNIFVYNSVWMVNEDLITELYVYNAATDQANLVGKRSNADFTALLPVALTAAENVPQAIWYTQQPWGIGGDIVFPPLDGLIRLDLQTGTETLLLAEGLNPAGLSPDQTIVAYVPVTPGYLNEPNPTLKFYNIESGTIHEILLLPSSERGAGYATFSPDNRYAAWMEASGWQMAEVPSFTSRVRIADLAGNPLADLPVDILASVTGVTKPTWAEPVGWLDGENLMIEIRGEEWHDTTLVKVRYDGSGLTYLAPGGFAGFVYP